MAPKAKAKAKAKNTKRGAKASRSSFRAKPTRAKVKAKPARRSSKPAKPSRAVTPAPRSPNVIARPTNLEQLGVVTAPTGRLCVFDVGLVGYLPRPALEPALVVADVPSDRELAVVGRRVGKGRFADCWDHVAIAIHDGEVAHAKKLGEAGVDFARLICMDKGALDHWQHEDSLDGLSDFVFWGRDEVLLAKVMRAPRIPDGYGWTDLTVAEAEARADRAAVLKANNHWLLAMDLRPHSHHFHALAAARASRCGAGTLEVGGATTCMFFTSWGDGVFPIYLDVDHDDQPVRIRIQLATEASNAAMRSVNSRP
ncbi:MAG TPA: hypothetical protein VGO00_02810 [Kofleriaceae bacterium]|nr:hypothetical protein [Kofleriaceae bacterium]